jgi:hypothetical protein
MTLAIEPMITMGRPEVYVHDDDWSISSVDESLAAHFEHTVAVTPDGPRILTRAHSVVESGPTPEPGAGGSAGGAPSSRALLR